MHKLMQLCEEVYGERLTAFEEITCNYDFDKFLRSYRPAHADNGIQKWFAVDLEVRSCGDGDRVFTRAKKAIGDKTKWCEWTQMYPSLLDARVLRPHAPADVPPRATNKLWEDFPTRVGPTLLRWDTHTTAPARTHTLSLTLHNRFYGGRMKHGIAIPQEEKDEMQSFLRNGPVRGDPPAWIDWDVADDEIPELVDNSSSDGGDEYAEDSDGDDPIPFLHLPLNPAGRTCRCGSRTHRTITSHACPLNPRNSVDGDDDNAAPADAAPADATTADDAPADAATADDAHADDTTPDEDLDEAVPSVRGRRRRDDGDDNAAPERRRGRRNFMQKNADVEVLYEAKWWPARIIFKHRGNAGYAVHYHDEEGCEEENVPEERIRSPQD